jgi:hypothetical protein
VPDTYSPRLRGAYVLSSAGWYRCQARNTPVNFDGMPISFPRSLMAAGIVGRLSILYEGGQLFYETVHVGKGFILRLPANFDLARWAVVAPLKPRCRVKRIFVCLYPPAARRPHLLGPAFSTLPISFRPSRKERRPAFQAPRVIRLLAGISILASRTTIRIMLPVTQCNRRLGLRPSVPQRTTRGVGFPSTEGPKA